MRSVNVDLVLEDGKISTSRLEIFYENNEASIESFDINEKFKARDYFSCLNLLREYLEKINCRILINGSRYDVYPSRMSLQMSNGLYAYKLVMGEQAHKDDLVNIFELAPQEKIVTIKEQREYFEKWVDSLG